jgi:hypothetical protein
MACPLALWNVLGNVAIIFTHADLDDTIVPLLLMTERQKVEGDGEL